MTGNQTKMITFATSILKTMDFRTPTDITPLNPRLHHSGKLLVMGSCFAEHIGTRLERMKFRVMINPYGVLYNPLSIAEALTRLIKRHPFTEEDLREFPDGGWNTWLHHSRYSHPDKQASLASINHSMESASSHLSEAETLIITFGTAWVYRLKENDHIVGNCHKVPERMFTRQRLTAKDIANEYSTLLRRLWQLNPKLHILFTVSPIRHLKDGLHGNQLSKATLLLAIDELCTMFPEQCHYFPAYEIVIDELRDYRFYADDMAHPSTLAIEYVWEQFVEHCIEAEAQQFMQQWKGIVRDLEHRPFQPESEQYQQFILRTASKISALKAKYPYLDFESEISCCHHLAGK